MDPQHLAVTKPLKGVNKAYSNNSPYLWGVIYRPHHGIAAHPH